MIADVDEPEPIDFTWFYFIGRTKLKLTFKETGRMTPHLFFKLYAHYKSTWDLEMRLFTNRMTYDEAFMKSQEEQEWF